MIDISKACEPKSDQTNFDDLVGGSRTIKITEVKVVEGEQPVHICYEGGEGRPYKPCKSMIRVLVKVWGKDASTYAGRSLTLFGDGGVKWAGSEVGGIRISHMSDIPKQKLTIKGIFKMMLTKSRGKREMYKVMPLETEPENEMKDAGFKVLSGRVTSSKNMAELSEVAADIKAGNYDKAGRDRIKAVYSSAVERIRGEE